MNRKYVVTALIAVSIIGAFSLGAKTDWFGVTDDYRCNSPRVFVSPDPCVGKEVEIIGWVGWVRSYYIRIFPYEWMTMNDEIGPHIYFRWDYLSDIVDDRDTYLGDYVRIKGTLEYMPNSRKQIYVISEVNLISTYESHRKEVDELLKSAPRLDP